MLTYDQAAKAWRSRQGGDIFVPLAPRGAVPPSGRSWNLYLDERFTSLNTDLWYRYHSVYGSGGFGSIDHLRPENVTADGTLKIITKRETYTGPEGTRDFTSAFISTGRRGPQAQPEPSSDTFFPREGFYEIRARCRQGQGLTQAFWLRHRAGGGGSVADVSIVENLHAQTPGRTHQVANLNGSFNTYKVTPFFQDPWTTPEWHTFGFGIWDEGDGIRFRWFIDGVQTGNFKATNRAFWDDYSQDLLWDVSLNTHTGGFYAGHPDDDPVGRLHALSPPRCAIGYTTTGYPDSCSTSSQGHAIRPWYAQHGDALYEINYLRVWELT